jgi:hypothetical protein
MLKKVKMFVLSSCRSGNAVIARALARGNPVKQIIFHITQGARPSRPRGDMENYLLKMGFFYLR